MIQRRFKSYTHTYAVLTQLIMLLVLFLDLALTIYLTHQNRNWHGWPFLAGMLIISVYFILITRSLNFRVKAEKEAAKEANNKSSPLIQDKNEQDQEGEDSDSEGEDIKEDDGGSLVSQEPVKRRV